MRTLHRLGQCYMIPGMDYMRFSCAGTILSSTSDFDMVCKWCSKSAGFVGEQNSSATNTSLRPPATSTVETWEPGRSHEEAQCLSSRPKLPREVWASHSLEIVDEQC